ncbi:CpsB/CapC family capsule biosynthesis tyrosine phosphatase [Butyrivibrio sp. INlla16]|uniref:CpsB/CapC family capsule biosynthesis tyrosine phosphatase n=1 Tax=Butyrivibrio sp. INlla16 TaxID=1520807 RepID=UPI00089082D6|nr:CpsB/CapC family capsule biosynthesis tyrosine phosphatase [Butyrivibrio sp. INlla16]SDB51874.1 protein-tyrosine phosphatase [Butyrivibrio sp. INlla16]
MDEGLYTRIPSTDKGTTPEGVQTGRLKTYGRKLKNKTSASKYYGEKMEKRQGVDYIFATPHSMAFNHDADKVKRAFEELSKAVYAARVDVHIDLGCEMFCHPGNVLNCISKLKDGIYPSFGQYVLTELPTYGIGLKDALFCVNKLREEGYTPVLAHVERYEFTDVESISFLKEKGALVQINAYSLSKMESASTRKIATELVKFGLVDFIGSDAHRLDHRPPMIEEGVRKLLELTSEEQAMWILAGNPKERLLRGC